MKIQPTQTATQGGKPAAHTFRLLGFLASDKGKNLKNQQTGGLQTVPGLTPSKRILIVDDDPIVLKTTSAKLTQAGHQVITAADGSEAISSVREQKPDVILLDVNFPPDVAHGGSPSWDGFRLMYWLRGLQKTEGSRYIFISGTDSAEFRERARNSGALAFLPKPIDHRKLLDAIANETKLQPDLPAPRRWWVTFFEFL